MVREAKKVKATSVKHKGLGRGKRKDFKGLPGEKDENGKYCDHFCEQIKMLAMLGAPTSVIAGFFDISEKTLNDWFTKRVGFRQAWLEGGTLADAKVAMAMFKRATGWEHEATKIFCNKDGDVTVVPFIERYPGDVTAQVAWLKARSGPVWNAPDKKELSGPNGEPVKTEATVQFYIPDNGRAKDVTIIDVDPV